MVATPLVIHAGVVHLLWVSFFRRGVNLHSVEFKFAVTILKFKISSHFRGHHVSDLGPRSGDFWPKWDQNFQLPQYALSQGALFNVAATNTGLHDKTTYSRLIANLHVQTLTVFFCWELFYIALSHNKNTFQELSWKVIKTAANDDENSPDALPTIAFQRQNDGVFPHNFFMVNGNIMKSFKKQFHLASLVFNLIG